MKLKSHAVGISNNFSVKASTCIANIRVGRRFLVGAVSSTVSLCFQLNSRYTELLVWLQTIFRWGMPWLVSLACKRTRHLKPLCFELATLKSSNAPWLKLDRTWIKMQTLNGIWAAAVSASSTFNLPCALTLLGSPSKGRTCRGSRSVPRFGRGAWQPRRWHLAKRLHAPWIPMETNAAVKLFVWRLRSSGTSLVFHSFFHVLEDANLGQEMLPQYKSFWRKTYFKFLPFLQKLLLHWNIPSFLLTSFEKEAFLFELFSVSFQCSCITSLLFVSVYKIWYKSQKDSKW